MRSTYSRLIWFQVRFCIIIVPVTLWLYTYTQPLPPLFAGLRTAALPVYWFAGFTARSLRCGYAFWFAVAVTHRVWLHTHAGLHTHTTHTFLPVGSRTHRLPVAYPHLLRLLRLPFTFAVVARLRTRCAHVRTHGLVHLPRVTFIPPTRTVLLLCLDSAHIHAADLRLVTFAFAHVCGCTAFGYRTLPHTTLPHFTRYAVCTTFGLRLPGLFTFYATLVLPHTWLRTVAHHLPRTTPFFSPYHTTAFYNRILPTVTVPLLRFTFWLCRLRGCAYTGCAFRGYAPRTLRDGWVVRGCRLPRPHYRLPAAVAVARLHTVYAAAHTHGFAVTVRFRIAACRSGYYLAA